MSYLVDTNVLLRSVQSSHPAHGAASEAVRRLFAAGETLYLTPQNLIEFWAVATRPLAVNGLEMSVSQTAQETANFKSLFAVLADTPMIFPEWERLVIRHEVKGKPTHDARLVAAMVVQGISHLLTFNTDDFKRFTEVTAVDPHDVATIT